MKIISHSASLDLEEGKVSFAFGGGALGAAGD